MGFAGKSRLGFTLIELMIVIAIIAIIGAIAIPGLLRSRSHANETSAIGSLKAISSGIEQFRIACAVDLDKNGIGEYGYLEELTGGGNFRINNAGGVGGQNAGSSANWASSVFGATDANGCAAKSGYFFVVYLPSGPAAGSCLYPNAVDIGLAERSYVCYAFPVVMAKTGVRVFAISPLVIPFGWGNNQSTYVGSGNAPPWNACMGDTNGDGGVDWSDKIDEGGTGQTGAATDKWVQIS